jgi:hypothetical protein
MIPGPQLPGPGFFHRIPAVSSYFRVLPEASICLTNPRFEISNLKSMIWNSRLLITNAYQPRFEINNLKSMIWNSRLLMITNAYQPRFEISDY